MTTTRPTGRGYRDVSPRHVAAASADVLIVDVREPTELASDLGRLPGAENVPLADVQRAAAGWDLDRAIVLVCRSGARSSRAAAVLAAMGFRHVMNMEGGMIAWNGAGLPVAR